MSPRAPRKPCAAIGCPELVEAGTRFCRDHRRQDQRLHDSRRGTPTARGYNNRWQKYVKWYKRQNPLCMGCERNGILKPTFAVDHIQPVNGPDDPRFWDPTNHQPLCESCHNRKTGRELGRGG